MPPEETATPDAPKPVADSPSPTVETPIETPPPETAQIAPETTPAPIEATPAPETAPASAEATTDAQPAPPTAQIPPNEPIAPESEPIETAPEPLAAASAPAPVIVQTGILHSAREFLGKARVAIQDRKRKKRDKIMAALNTKNRITNDEVEKLLHVSDATATRYLSALEKEGKIIQVGKQGKGILYIKTP